MGRARGEGRRALLLEGQRVRLRELGADEHRRAWRAFLADPEVARWLGGAVPAAPLTLGIERVTDGALIGGVALADVSEDGRAELVIAIGRADARGQGYGREAIRLIVEHALGRLGLREVFLRVQADNQRAIRCYLACGFVKEARLMRRGDGAPARPVLLMSNRTAV
jgi:RimJ/RimL family protein N-acetyltransferase